MNGGLTLRHPTVPSLSLAGVRLVLPDHALGLPVLRALSLCACCRHYPGAAAGAWSSLITRVAARTLALSPICDRLHRRLQPFRHLHDCSGCFRLERLPGGARTHWKATPCHGAHVERPFVTAAVNFGRSPSAG